MNCFDKLYSFIILLVLICCTIVTQYSLRYKVLEVVPKTPEQLKLVNTLSTLDNVSILIKERGKYMYNTGCRNGGLGRISYLEKVQQYVISPKLRVKMAKQCTALCVSLLFKQ